MVRATGFVAIVLAAAVTLPAAAQEDAVAKPAKTVCQLIEESAARHEVPVRFFTRLVWKESRFRPDAVSGKGAQGIAQFMPGTAALRSLADPFDPETAIDASAHYLRDLAIQFGNLGLAAAAYNAGEQRVTNWLAGKSQLPWETQDYVLFITGQSPGEWQAALSAPPLAAAPDKAACTEIAQALATSAGSAAVATRQFKGAPFAPWGVQVAGGFSETRALASYASLQKKFPADLGGREPLILRAVIRTRGRAPFTQVRLPTASREEAERLCARLHAAGGACIVMKNSR